MTPPVAIAIDLVAAKKELQAELHRCSRRGLQKTSKWLAELNYSLRDTKIELSDSLSMSAFQFENIEHFDVYVLCKGFFDNQEYLRCAYFAERYTYDNALLRFLRFYSLYKDSEKKRLENMCDLSVISDPKQMDNLTDLTIEIASSYPPNASLKNFSAYDLYLLGIISRRLGDTSGAIDFLIASINSRNYLWGAWLELSFLVSDRKALSEMEKSLPDCVMKYFFLGHMYLELHMNEKALKTYLGLQKAGLHESLYIKSQIAIAYHNVQRVDEAIESFDVLSVEDPFRLDDMDLFSNMLYVKGDKYQLQILANKVFEIDKYRVETCCIVGNLHSLRREHHKAIEYFERALRLNPHYLSAWTLMGHEFMEIKNSNAAIQCYREAVESNRHDYRAWNGLGQTYDILKMPAYSLYYYKQAHRLRPNDSRLLTALGEAYEKLERPKNAGMCYERARQLGDIEGLAILRLAKMQKVSDPEKAAKAFLEYLQEMETHNVADRDEQGKAHLFLANYYFTKTEFESSYTHAFKCLEFPEVKDDGKTLLVKLAQAKEPPVSRAEGEDGTLGTTEVKMEVSVSADETAPPPPPTDD